MVIGLDGGTWAVLCPYMQAGFLPTLARLWERAYRAELRTTFPPITPVAWASMVTGVNPGKHRVFGFGTYRDAGGEYVGRCVHRGHIARPTLWRILSRHERVSRVVNVPMTYPPEEIKGSIVTGMFTPGPDAPYAFPAKLKEELLTAGIRPKFVTDFARGKESGAASGLDQLLEGDGSRFLDDLDDLTRRQHQVACHLVRKDWHFFMKVYVATDRIQHFLYDELLPPPVDETASPRARRIAMSLKLVDDCIGELIELAGPDCTVMIVSDHGFGRCLGEYSLGCWLAERGHAAFRANRATGTARRIVRSLGLGPVVRRLLGDARASRLSARTFPLDWNRTKVFVDDATAGHCLRINTKGRFKSGVVEPGGDYERFRDELIRELKDLRVDGVDLPPITQVLKREEVYQGPYVAEAPDLLLMTDPRALLVFVNRRIAGALLEHVPERAGDHLMEGICMVTGPGIRADDQMHRADITDVAPTALARLGLPVPEDMDGRVLTEAFAEPPTIVIEQGGTDTEGLDVPEAFTEDEKREIEDRLRNLGYLE